LFILSVVVIGDSLLGSLPVKIAIPCFGIEPEEETAFVLLFINVIVLGALVVKLVSPGALIWCGRLGLLVLRLPVLLPGPLELIPRELV
jgi:hypothetical protein